MRLIERLVDFSAMEHEAGRKAVVELLSFQEEVTSNSQVRDHITNIVHTCMYQPRGLEAL